MRRANSETAELPVLPQYRVLEETGPTIKTVHGRRLSKPRTAASGNGTSKQAQQLRRCRPRCQTVADGQNGEFAKQVTGQAGQIWGQTWSDLKGANKILITIYRSGHSL